MEIKFDDLKIGQHLWVLYEGKLAMVAKTSDYLFCVCGNGQYGEFDVILPQQEYKIISLVDPPKGYENTEFYSPF